MIRYSIYHTGTCEEVVGVETQQAEKKISFEGVDCGNCPSQTPNYEEEVYVCSSTGKKIGILFGFVARDCSHFPKELYGGGQE